MHYSPYAVLLSTLVAAGAVQAQAAADAPPSTAAKAGYQDDNDRFDGDKLTLRTRLTGFRDADATAGTSVFCAPAESELKVVREEAGDLLVRFTRVGKNGDAGADLQCAADKLVKAQFIAYRIAKAAFTAGADFKRTGVSFGALIVPFKFRTGDREIVSSSTVAPYLGWRTGWGSTRGVSFTPIFSAGLGLVPVTDTASGRTETKSALSFATGLVMGSTKNEAFQAGLLVGRDFLGRRDRTLDPGSDKPWISFYVGYTLSQN